METQSLLPITDNITEVLVMILDFTRERHKILIENLNNVNTEGFVPKDLAVDEFAGLVDSALSEHIRCGRLALSDSTNVKFAPQGRFDVSPIIDDHARRLFETDIEQYLELQKKKLSENSLNSRLTAQLVKKKQANER